MGFDEPKSIDITTIDDPYIHRIMNRPLDTITSTGSTSDIFVYRPPFTTGWQTGPYKTTITAEDWSKVLSWKEMMTKLGKKEEAEVNVVSKKSADKQEHIVLCEDLLDLSVERVLTTLSAVKGRLMYEIAPIHIKEIQCKMTPLVKTHIITASKKLRMYGKTSPIIPSFDEYGNRLPDQIEIGDSHGITVQIVDPEKYGEVYFELKAIEFPNTEYTTKSTWTYDLEDLPF